MRSINVLNSNNNNNNNNIKWVLWFCRFTDCKLHSIDSAQDAAIVLRTIASQKLNKILLREYRPHLLASSVTYEPKSAEQVITLLFVSLL